MLAETGQVPANLVAERICDGLANGWQEDKVVGQRRRRYLSSKNGRKADSLLDAALYLMKAKPRGPNASTPRKDGELRRGAAVGGKTDWVSQ